MRIDVATLFPEMCERILDESIIGRARKKGVITVNCHNIRDYSYDKHRRVDDTPYGGGMGMVMQCEPIYNCFKAVTEGRERPYVIYMSPKGKVLNQLKSIELSEKEDIFIICGHYEGIDQRIIDKIVDGGELPAMVLIDSVARMCGGVLSSSECFEEESHFSGLLEYPQYTKPEVWEDMSVPPVLLTGHHKNIAEWRRNKSVEITAERRPDMMKLFKINKKI